MRNECSIIRDILPLYAENMTSPPTNAFVQEHLAACESCSHELSLMQHAGSLPLPESPSSDPAPIQALKRKWNRKNAIILLLLLLSAILIGGYLFILCHRPFEVAVPSLAEEIQVTTWMEPWEAAYGNRRFRIEFEHLAGKALNLSQKDTYQTDAWGRKINTGYILEIRETVWDFFGTAKYQQSIGMAYAYEEETLPDDFDFTITVIYKDQTTTYSMAEEGLFASAY